MLKVVHLRSGYGRLQVLEGVSLHVNSGEVVALLGANGAGKSTLLKTLAGLLPASEGRILWRGQDLAGRPAHAVAREGVVLVPEGRGLFYGMSVLDNLRMGGYAKRMSAQLAKQRIEQACTFFPALRERLAEPAGQLSGGQQQMLALARALVGDPRVLLLDEPSTGLAPLLVAQIFGQIRQLGRSGIAVILAEQNVQGALRLADRAYVLKSGKIVLDGPTDELMQSEEIKKAYLGM